MNRGRILFFSLLSALGGFGLLHCGDDDVAPAPKPDAQTDAGPVSDASDLDVAADAIGNPLPSPRKWTPQVFAVDLRPQPNAMFAAAPPNGFGSADPPFTVPFVAANNEKGVPKRMPDLFVDSPSVAGVGFGCVGYKFSPNNPFDPKGPGLTHGDMGDVTINGHTGGVYFSPQFQPMLDAGIPKPITCKHGELFPGSGDAGLFAYGCNAPQNPATAFLQKTDMITANVAGGADFGPWALAVPPSQNDNITIKNDLWAVTAAMVDGTQDLKIEYDCGGAPCGPTSIVTVIIQSTDGRDAAPTSPFDFPNAKNEWGLVNCIEHWGAAQSSFTVKKELLALIPSTWTDLRVIVGTLNTTTNQVDNQRITLASGFARFGISHK